jgi:hypothetical protein
MGGSGRIPRISVQCYCAIALAGTLAAVSGRRPRRLPCGCRLTSVKPHTTPTSIRIGNLRQTSSFPLSCIGVTMACFLFSCFTPVPIPGAARRIFLGKHNFQDHRALDLSYKCVCRIWLSQAPILTHLTCKFRQRQSANSPVIMHLVARLTISMTSL